MRLANLVHPERAHPALAIVRGDEAAFIDDAELTSIDEVVRSGALERLRSLEPTDWFPLAEATFAPALLHPSVILAVGLNYAAHSGELNLKTDDTPTVFTLWPNSVAEHKGTTSWSRSLTRAVDYEAELGVIIGAAARDVSEDDALDFVFGYTVVNDISARDIQYSETQWCRCKSLDGFTPIGPVVVTADEIADPQDLRIWTSVNGQIVQDASTAQMMRPVAKLISHLSRGVTLLPGTVISTGSPGGSGYSRSPQVLLDDGTVVTCGVQHIGELTTHCHVTD